jgi:hypothetical protein
MKRLKIIGLALVAMFAMSAVAASAASAVLPEFLHSNVCTGMAGMPGGFPENVWHWTNNTCTTVSATQTGNFALSPYKSTSGKGKLEAKGGLAPIECQHDSNLGELTGPKTDKVFVTFTECTAAGGKCQNTAVKGEIKTKELESLLVYKNKAAKEVALLLTPVGAAGEKFTAPITCETILGNIKVEVRGTLLGVWSAASINKKTKTFELSFKQKGGVQEPTEYENEKGEKVKPATFESNENGGAFKQSGEETTDTITTLEENELKG